MNIHISCIFFVSNQTLVPYSSSFAPKGANNTSWLTLLLLILFPFVTKYLEEQESDEEVFPGIPSRYMNKLEIVGEHTPRIYSLQRI